MPRLRESEAARAAFRAVLALDPEHPRAMLGLARIALEGGDAATAGQLLDRALRIYPDFPEALALLDATRSVAGAGAGAAAAAAPAGATAARLARSPVRTGPANAILLAAGGGVCLRPSGHGHARGARRASRPRGEPGRGHAGARGHGSPLRRAAVAANPGTTFLQTDSRHVLAVTLPPEVPVAIGQGQTAELWKRFIAEGSA